MLPEPDQFVDWREWAERARRQQAETLPRLPHYSVNNLPPANADGMLIFVPDETGGPTVAFSHDGDWRRVQDRSVVA
jgi:hypothetical protein